MTSELHHDEFMSDFDEFSLEEDEWGIEDPLASDSAEDYVFRKTWLQ